MHRSGPRRAVAPPPSRWSHSRWTHFQLDPVYLRWTRYQLCSAPETRNPTIQTTSSTAAMIHSTWRANPRPAKSSTTSNANRIRPISNSLSCCFTTCPPERRNRLPQTRRPCLQGQSPDRVISEERSPVGWSRGQIDPGGTRQRLHDRPRGSARSVGVR